MQVSRTDRLYHYLISGEAVLPAILEHGLLPLSAFPEGQRWRDLEAMRPGFYREIYALFAAPVVRRPYRNSGVFLTPIDFRLLPDLVLAKVTRIALPLAAIERDSAALTYVRDEERVTLSLAPETLAETARLWPAEAVREWFARDRSRVFFYVPQVAAYQEGGIPVRPEWVERPGGPAE